MNSQKQKFFCTNFSQFNLSALSLGFIHLILYSFCDLVSSFLFDRILFDKSNNHFKGSTKEHQRLELRLVILDNITNDKNYEGQMKSKFFFTKVNNQPLFDSFIDLNNIWYHNHYTLSLWFEKHFFHWKIYLLYLWFHFKKIFKKKVWEENKDHETIVIRKSNKIFFLLYL